MGRPLVKVLGSYSRVQQAEMARTYRECNEARHDAAAELIPGVRETLRCIACIFLPCIDNIDENKDESRAEFSQRIVKIHLQQVNFYVMLF